MDKLDKRTIQILEKILKLLENVGDDQCWNNIESVNKENEMLFLN
ncbi:hypothetical protein [Crassaminicella thermophila]|nr:hypothetical protein [Crassaminicella thermophila]